MRKFTETDDAYLRANYTLIPAKRMSNILGRSESCARQRMKILGLVVPPEVINKFKKDSQIQPGTVPPNKGKKQSEYMTPEAIERTAKTRFKKGDIPHSSYNEIGKITIRQDHKNRAGKSYKHICIDLGNWKPLHSFTWESVNGKLPKGHCLWFIDGDTMNCELSNLELITRAENMLRNSASIHLPDKFVAGYIAKQGQTIDRGLRDEILNNHPKLVEAKRTQLLINRKIKSIENGTK
jgi:hypothetical protein